MKKILLLLACGTALLMVGCAGVPGATESEVPPRMVKYGDTIQWDNAGKFGPIPPSRSTAASSECAKLNTGDTKYVATGYHSKAQNLAGTPFPDGAYFCTRQ